MAQIILDSNNNLIQGDFDNATLNNRTKLQTTTTNATTNVYVVPNGSSTSAGVSVANNSSLTNASKIVMATNGSTDVQIISGVNGSGTYLPLSFYTNNALAAQISTAGVFSATGGIAASSMPTGSVLQVVNASTMANIQTSSTSFVTTGFSASITPKFSTSKIFAIVSGGGAYASANSGATLYATIYRNSTNLGDATYGLCRFTNNAGGPYVAPNSMSVLDSPATTSSTTYTCYFKNAGSAGTVDFSYSDRGNVSLTLMEIAG